MSEKNTPDSYEVGYGRPPKDAQFKKGVSGNPKGRPKKTLDFDYALIKESQTLMTINENGQSKRVPKHEVAFKQLLKQAMTGSTSALRMYFDLLQQARERIAEMPASQPNNSEEYTDVKNLSDEELMKVILKNLPDEEWDRLIMQERLKNKERETKEGHISNAD